MLSFSIERFIYLQLNYIKDPLMFAQRKIENENVDMEWIKLKKTILRDVAYNAAEVIGEFSAVDMLDFSDLAKSDIDTIYVKDRDGLPMASGIRRILPDVDVIPIHTKRTGLRNEIVEVTSLEPKKIKYNEDGIKWFIDPMNARGTTSIEVLRYLYNAVPFETALISHIAAHNLGIRRVQAQITDFNMHGFMNYAFLSKELDESTGFLKDALEVIPDFGDKVFGTIGEDYKESQYIDDLKRMLGTNFGEIEKLKGMILLLLSGKNIFKMDKNVGWAAGKWIRNSVTWYMKNRRIKINLNIDSSFDSILKELEERGFIKHDEHPWEFKKSKYKAYDYYLTEEGTNITYKIYIPFLEHVGVYRIILRDLEYMVHRTSRKIESYSQ